MIKLASALLAATIFSATAHADTLPSVAFSPAPPASAQAHYVARARALVGEMITAARERPGARNDGAVMVLWHGAALAHTDNAEVCSAVNVLASLRALPSHAAAVCLATDDDYTIVLASAGTAGSAAGKGGAR